MNRKLWTALLAVLALTAFMMGRGEEDTDLVPAQSGREARGKLAPRTRQAPPVRTPEGRQKEDAALQHALIEAVQQWQQRQVPKPAPHGITARPSQAGWMAAAPPPPPTIAAAPVAEPPPMAPPFHMPWVGRFNDGTPDQPDIERAVLADSGRTLVVRAGDVIAGQWRVDRIHDRTMTLTYLPLNQPQTVAMR